MSSLASPGGDDHPEAAGKHLADATVLQQEGRSDGATYLAGYVVECVMKTLLLLEAGSQPGGHDLNALSQAALRLAALPGARTSRYVPVQTPGHALHSQWKPNLRYRAPGTMTLHDALDWVSEARAVYETSIVPMRLDGIL
jgi:hypothetical protein